MQIGGNADKHWLCGHFWREGKMFVCKTVHQYSKGEISDEDMAKLKEIAEDYRTVKNYVYAVGVLLSCRV